MINHELLRQQGYRSSSAAHRPYAHQLWAKKVFTDNDRQKPFLYQVEFYEYLLSETVTGLGTGWTAEATLYPKYYDREAADPWVTLQIHHPKSIEYVESFFADAFRKLECIPDPHNQ